MWAMFGENAIVIEGDYNGRHELDYFIDHPASSEERDWQAIEKKAGIGMLGGGKGVLSVIKTCYQLIRRMWRNT